MVVTLFLCNSKHEALIEACKKGDKLQVEALIADGAAVNYKNENSECPLSIAYINHDTAILSILLKHNAFDSTVYAQYKQQILKAIQLNDVKTIQQIYSINFNFNFEIEHKTPLIYCILTNNTKMVEFLINLGVDVVPNSDTTFSPIHDAMALDNRIYTLLCSKSKNIDILDKDGKTALMNAIERDNKSKFDILLGFKQNIEIKETKGLTALAHAIKVENPYYFEALIKKGANVYWTNKSKQNLLHLALENNRNTYYIKRLVQQKININQRDSNLVYPLFLAQVNKSQDITSYLLAHGAIDYNAQIIPLFAAAKHGNLDSVKLLHSQGMSCDATLIWNEPGDEDLQGSIMHENVLSQAIYSRNTALISYLIDNGASINASIYSIQPLYEAICSGQYSVADFLLKRGANPSIEYVMKPSYYDVAVNNLDTTMLQYLITHNFTLSQNEFLTTMPALCNAAKVGNMLFVSKISENAIIPELKEQCLSEALCWANNIEVAKFLIDKGANPNFEFELNYHEGSIHRTAINNATELKDINLLRYLLKNGSDITISDSYIGKYTDIETISNPLSIAVKNNDFEMIKYLIENKCTINFYTILVHSSTVINNPLFIAIENKNTNIIEYLLNHGAKTTIENTSALDIAQQTGDLSVINLIKQKLQVE